MISSRILADSINPLGSRLTTFLVTYPRFIHSEIMTHRAFSRNAASSRAIPFKRMVADIRENAAKPEFWAAEHKGMSPTGEVDEYAKGTIKDVWESASHESILFADALNKLGLAKSLCNRLLEPFAHMTVLITASNTGYSNFFALRAHPAAMPEFQVLAYRMLDTYLKSDPNELGWGEWHYPRFTRTDCILGEVEATLNWTDIMTSIKVATARCARLSYLTFDGDHSPKKDIALHDQLLASKHMSPFEHCAQAVEYYEANKLSNFDLPATPINDGLQPPHYRKSGWLQYRKMIEGENQTNADLAAIYATKPDWITI